MKKTAFFTSAFVIWMYIIIKAHFDLILNYQKSYPEQKQQIKALILAITAFSGGTMNFFPSLGFNIYPYGNFLIPIHAIFITYAILKYQLLDIKLVYKKGLLYTLLIAIISSIYLITVFVVENFLRSIFTYQSFFLSGFVAFIIGLVFFPLRNRIEGIIDKYFFKGTPEEIAAQNERLRQEVVETDRYKSLSTLASGIAHEIKNPLTSIKTFSDYLPQKSNDPEFIKNFSRIVSGEVERIDHLVHELLDYSNPAKASLKPIDIHRLLDDSLQLLNNQTISQKIVMHKNFHAPSKLILNIDEAQIRQAILNIFLNAIEAMPGGGELTVETKSDRRNFQLKIRDTGVGIKPQDLPHIFDPFFSKKDNGTGLGLSITQTIIQNHNGTIRALSEENKGTEFIIKIPLKAPKTS